MKITADFST